MYLMCETRQVTHQLEHTFDVSSIGIKTTEFQTVWTLDVTTEVLGMGGEKHF